MPLMLQRKYFFVELVPSRGLELLLQRTSSVALPRNSRLARLPAVPVATNPGGFTVTLSHRPIALMQVSA